MARRKEFRKAAFAEFPNCLDKTSPLPERWADFFGNEHPLTLELGCGKGDFSLEMARRHPQRNFLGLDLKRDRMWYAAQQAQQEDLTNVGFLALHLLEIDGFFSENEVAEIWITFPDPYPKKRQAKHRMINPPFLERYARILSPQGRMKYKTDNRDLFLYSLEVFVREGNISFHQLSFDLHEDETIGEDPRILTAYERSFLEMGKQINFVEFSFSGPEKEANPEG